MSYTVSKLKMFAACAIIILCALAIRAADFYPHAVEVFGNTYVTENRENLTISDLAENLFDVVNARNDS